MSHLNDEQFEQILQGIEFDPKHMEECEHCRNRLAEKKALAERLRSAFANVEAGQELAQSIREQIDSKSKSSQQVRGGGGLALRAHWRGWTAAVSGMAALIAIGVLLTSLGNPSPAMAAQEELVAIHRHNLTKDHEFHSEADPEKLAAYFKSKLGFNPRMPEPGHGLALRGCCVKHFQGQVTGSYVVDTPEGVMSVVVVADTPESMGITGKFEFDGYTYFKSSFAKCDMVSVRIGDYSYCAVGEISHSYLTELLSRLLPDKDE